MTLPLTLLECSHRITPAAAATWRSEDHVARVFCALHQRQVRYRPELRTWRM